MEPLIALQTSTSTTYHAIRHAVTIGVSYFLTQIPFISEAWPKASEAFNTNEAMIVGGITVMLLGPVSKLLERVENEYPILRRLISLWTVSVPRPPTA